MEYNNGMSAEQDLQKHEPLPAAGDQILIGRKEIRKIYRKLSDIIIRDYKDKNPVIIGIAKGAITVVGRIVQRLQDNNFGPFDYDFVGSGRYGAEREGSDELKLTYLPEIDLEGRHVILVDDIIDDGITLARWYNEISKLGPASIEPMAYLMKDKEREVAIPIRDDYIGAVIPDVWVYGSGLDDRYRGRALPDLWFKPSNAAEVLPIEGSSPTEKPTP